MTTRVDPLRHLTSELSALEEQGLLRLPPPPIDGPSSGDRGASPLVLCSNDYLGYVADTWPLADGDSVVAGAGSSRLAGAGSSRLAGAGSSRLAGAGSSRLAGAGSSRLVAGEHLSHVEAEGEIARWLRTEASLLFSSGYAANVGTIAALAGPGDVIISDALNHASIIDGCRLSRARIVVVPHCDTTAVERALATAGDARRRWVVTESYFSMNGDSPDLAALRALCDSHDAALYVDEAHALGVFGPEGRGRAAQVGVTPEVLIGTVGKALGLQGAFVAGSSTLRTYLWNRARSFVFSTGISPMLAELIRIHVRRAARDDETRARLHANAARLRDGLAELGIEILDGSHGPILPWVVGDAVTALTLSRRLREHGVLVQAIRPPTVPMSTARLRIAATARLTGQDIERALMAFSAVVGRHRQQAAAE